MNKNVLKWTGGILLFILVLLFVAPFIFKGKVHEMITETINKNLKAKVAFEKVDLSLFRSFPKATVTIKNLSIVNEAPFEGDTLLVAENIGLKMSILELFNGKDKPMNIEEIGLRNADVNIIVNEQGLTNYDIVLTEEEEEEGETKKSEDSVPFSLSLKKYAIENMNMNYSNLGSKMVFKISELNHSGKGNLSANILDLTTESKAKVSFEKEGSKLMNNIYLALKAVIGVDMDKKIFTFKNNEALINQLPLKFDGSVQLLDDGQQYNLTFATPNSSFKNFLALVPAEYSGNIKDVKTEGDFRVSGKVEGKFTETTIPQLEILLASEGASFKYPDLPKSVDNIFFDAKIINETGLIDDTYVLVNKMAFQIDKDVFNANAHIKNITKNAFVNAKLNGVVNLSNLSKAYPVKLDKPLSGILKADVSTQFDMHSVEKNLYKNIKNSGKISLSDFNYETEEMAKPLQIEEASLVFNPNHVELSKLDLKTGTTDLLASGTLDNLYGFLFNKQKIKGNFKLKSNNFVVSDVLKANDQTAANNQDVGHNKKEAAEPLKIPSFLDCTIQADANTVVYDNLILKNVTGTLNIKDETAHLQHMKTDLFDGEIDFNGSVSTKETTPDFDMALVFNNLDVAKSFDGLDFLKAVAPIAGVIKGKINSTIKLNGKLDPATLAPDMNTLSGDLLGQLLSSQLSPDNSKLMATLNENISFIDLKKLNLDNVKAHLVFKNGHVQVKPFDLKYQDISVEVGGEHGFDKSMNYNLNFNVPPKYLGNEISGVLSKLSPNEADKLKAIPIKVGLTGSFDHPKVSTDMKEVVSDLTNQIVEQQANKLLDKGADALKNLLGGKKDSVENDTINNQESKAGESDKIIEDLGEGIKSLFGRKKKE